VKLYEFTFTVPDTDDFMPHTEREARVAEFLMGEAELQGWATGYEWRLVKATADMENCCLIYQYQVIGEYLD